jgi:hypothetical protein
MPVRRAFLPTLLACLLAPHMAVAFCGFYVTNSQGTRLENDASTVILVREGTRTVLSMQNNYIGPPEDFALVIPVPTVLGPNDVRVMPPGVFDHVSQLAAPRLVEYWERDPCRPHPDIDVTSILDPNATSSKSATPSPGNVPAVVVEAEFVVGEYEIVLLSSQDSLALERWLLDEHYAIPDGAAELLRPYVEQGSKFFVAKVDTNKLRFVDGEAVLSPLRVAYESEEFSLPIRLGMINAPESGTQDLIVHIIGASRFEVANYDNVAIPTNLDVADLTRDEFDAFYAELFDHTVAMYPGAVVTEYAWSTTTCDPCPVQTLSEPTLTLLGRTASALRDSTLTRLHLRYDAGAAGEDLVFREAKPLMGGTKLSPFNQSARVVSRSDTFQARYAIRHPWEGKVRCSDPEYGHWGPPPRGRKYRQATPVRERDAVSERTLDEYVLVELQPVTLLSTAEPDAPEPTEPDPTPTPSAEEPPPLTPTPSDGCVHCSSPTRSSGPLGVLLALCLLAWPVRRRPAGMG